MIRRVGAKLARTFEVILAIAAPGFLALLRRPISLGRCLLFFLGFTGYVSLLLFFLGSPPNIRTFDPIVMIGTLNIDDAFLGKLGEAQQAGDAIVLVAEVASGSIRFQRLEPIVGPHDPIQPQPHFGLFFWIFLACYAGSVFASLKDLFRERGPIPP